MDYRRFFSFIFPTFFLIAGCGPAEQESDADLMIAHVNIVDIENDSLLSDRTVYIRNGMIERITDSSQSPPASGAEGTVINGTGKYLLPGFWDNHVHFRGGDELIQENKNLLPLFIANGVTTVRDAGGDLTLSILEWKEKIQSGELSGPNIFTSGPKLDGPDAAWAGSIELDSPDDVSGAIDSLEAAGADYVKIYDSTLSGEVFLAIIEETEKRVLPVTGHMPYSVLFGEAVERGLDATEHMYYALKGSSSGEEEITNEIIERQNTRNPLGFWEALQGILDSYSDKKAAETYQKMSRNNTAAVPTIHIGETLSTLKGSDHSDDEYLDYIGPGIKETYERRLRGAMNASVEATRWRQNLQAKFVSIVPEMKQAGVSILAGSDSGPYNTYVYPGISLHQELKALVDAGLSPAEALQTSAPNGAAFFGLENEYGKVEPGFRADLVLLDENPLEDITQTQNIYMVIREGKHIYDSVDLNRMLRDLKAIYESS